MSHLLVVGGDHTDHSIGPRVRGKRTDCIGIDNQWNVGFDEFFDEFTDGVDRSIFSTQPWTDQNGLTTTTGQNTVEYRTHGQCGEMRGVRDGFGNQ